MQIKIDVVGQLDIKRRLALLKMPAAKRKRLTGQIARKIRVNSRRRIRQQVGLDGRPWQARKSKSRRKMMRGLSRLMTAKGSASAGTVTFTSSAVGGVARAQQEGVNETMTARKMARRYGRSDYQAPATRGQAKALKLEGFQVRKPSGKGYKSATLKQITETLTQGQAGLILQKLRDKTKKQTWLVPLPARSFLGATEQEINDMVTSIFDQTIGARG